MEQVFPSNPVGLSQTKPSECLHDGKHLQGLEQGLEAHATSATITETKSMER